MCLLNELINPGSLLLNNPEVIQNAWEKKGLFITEDRGWGGRETDIAIVHPLQR